MQRVDSLRGLVITGVAAVVLASCATEELPERQPIEYEDFGSEVYRVLHAEMRYSEHDPAAKMQVLEEARVDLIWALNRVIDSPVEEELQAALESILPHYEYEVTTTPCSDNAQCTGEQEYCNLDEAHCVVVGKIPRITRRLRDVLTKMGSAQFDALAKMAASHGAPPDAFNRLVYRLMVYERELFPPLHALVTEQEPHLTEIMRWAWREIQELEDEDPPARPTFGDKLLVGVDSALDTGAPAWAVVLDDNGNPKVNYENGDPLGPYVDDDGDGMVDTDGSGNPVDSGGNQILFPIFSDTAHYGEMRDLDGLAQTNTQPVFQYFDVKKTLLGNLLWNVNPMARDGVIWDLFTAFTALLGAKTTQVDEDGSYAGFDAADNPILDMLYAFNEIRRYPRLPQVLAVLKALALEHPQLLTELLTELGKTYAIFKGPDLMTPGNTLFDDLHPELEYLAQTGLLKRVLLALLDPRVDGLETGLYNMLHYTDIDVDPVNDLDCGLTNCDDALAAIPTVPFGPPTPFSQPDNAWFNMSIQQKFLILVAHTIDAPMEALGGLMPVTEDMATFYAEAMGGIAVMPAAANLALWLIPEFDDDTPTAEQMGLFMNHNQPVTGNPVCNAGELVKDHYGRMLLAFHRSGGLEALKPVAEAFAAVDDVRAFTDLFMVLHRHYGSQPNNDPTGVDFQYGSNMRGVEEPLSRMVSETHLLRKIIDLVRTLNGMTVAHEGQALNPIDELDGLVFYLLDTSEDLTTRTGELVYRGDGVSPVGDVSRLYLLFHAFDKVDRALAQDPVAKEAWDRVDLMGYLFDMDAGGQQLANPTTVPIVLNLVPILADEITEDFKDPGYLADLDQSLLDMEDFFESRGFSFLYEVMLLIKDDPRYAALKSLLDDLLFKATDASQGGDTDLFGALLAVMSDMIQSRIDCNAGKQLLRWFGDVIQPDDRVLFELVELMNYIYQSDTQRTFTELTKNLFREQRPGIFAINIIGDVVKAINRYDPSQRGPYSAQDFEHIITRLADYLIDPERGLERMYTIINDRD